MPVALVALSAIPLTAGTLRLIQLAGGPDVLPADHRFAGFPIPLVVHIVAAAMFALAGILQFVPRFRRRHRVWHRRAGRVAGRGRAAGGGLGALADALLRGPAGHRRGCSTCSAWSSGPRWPPASCSAFAAVRRRDIATHRAWMMRAYAIGLGAGTQVFTEGIGGAIFGTGVLAGDLAKGAAWVINLAVAEWASCAAVPRVAASHSPSPSKLERSHEHRHDVRDPRRGPPRRPLVGLARRARHDPRRRRRHHGHRPGRRPGAASRGARRPARHRRRHLRAPHQRMHRPQSAGRCSSARCTPSASPSVPPPPTTPRRPGGSAGSSPSTSGSPAAPPTSTATASCSRSLPVSRPPSSSPSATTPRPRSSATSCSAARTPGPSSSRRPGPRHAGRARLGPRSRLHGPRLRHRGRA